MSGAAVMLLGAKLWMKREHLAEDEEVAERDADEEQQRAGDDQRQHQLLLVRCTGPARRTPTTWYSTTGSASRNAAISVIFSGTRNGEITLVAISVRALRQVRDQRRGEQVVQRRRAGTEAAARRRTTPTAISARIRRSRSSIEVRDEGLLGARELVVFVGHAAVGLGRCEPARAARRASRRGHDARGRKRATRAAPDCALARMPLRCLYHCGVAPRFRRQFFFGCRYSAAAAAARCRAERRHGRRPAAARRSQIGASSG